MSQETVTLIKQSSTKASDYSRNGKSLPYDQGKLQVPMIGHTPSKRLNGRMRSRTGLTDSISSCSNAQRLKRGFKSVTRLSRTFLITAIKAILLLNSVHAEEESILNTAIVTSDCDAAICKDEQLVIGPSFKSRWFSLSNLNGDLS